MKPLIFALSIALLTSCATVGRGLEGFSNGWNQSYKPASYQPQPSMCTVMDHGTFKNVQCY